MIKIEKIRKSGYIHDRFTTLSPHNDQASYALV